MVSETSRPADERLLVTIRGRGNRRPIYLVHSLAGELTWLLPLAQRLDPEQPIYGFAAPGLNSEGPSFTRLEEMAAAYLAAVRKVQPHGPYILGGYSFGGVVAFEMARQACQAGEPVDRLLLIDAYTPASEVMQTLKRWSREGTLLQTVANLLGIQWRARALLGDGDLPREDPEAQVAAATHHLLSNCDVPHSYDALSALLGKCGRVMQVHTDLLSAYQPRPPLGRFGSLLIHNTEGFVGRNNALQLPEMPGSDRTHGWHGCLPEPPQKIGVAAEHFLIVQPPALDRVSSILEQCLARDGAAGYPGPAGAV